MQKLKNKSKTKGKQRENKKTQAQQTRQNIQLSWFLFFKP